MLSTFVAVQSPKSCPALWDPVDWSMPGSCVSHLSPGACRNSCLLCWWCCLSTHLFLCRPLLLLPSIFPSIMVFSNELAVHIRWRKYWSFSFSNSPSNEYPGLTSFIDWFDLFAVQGGHDHGRRAGAGAECRWQCMLESSCRSTGVQVASALGLEANKLYMCFLRAESQFLRPLWFFKS